MNWERRTNTIMAAGAIFFCGWISGAAYFRVHQLWQNTATLVQVEKKTIPALNKKIATVTCERGLARRAAGQAVAAANDDSVPLPDLETAKHDGCPSTAPVEIPKLSGMVPR